MAASKVLGQAKKFLESEGQGGGPPPFDIENNAIESSVIDAGKSELVTAAAPFVRVRSFVLFGATNVKIRPPHAELEE